MGCVSGLNTTGTVSELRGALHRNLGPVEGEGAGVLERERVRSMEEVVEQRG